MSTATRIRLSDDSIIWLDNVDVNVEREVAGGDLESRFAEALPAVKSVCQDLEKLLLEVGPAKASVEFGIGFKIEASGLTVLVAKGSADANFRIKLEWDRTRDRET